MPLVGAGINAGATANGLFRHHAAGNPAHCQQAPAIRKHFHQSHNSHSIDHQQHYWLVSSMNKLDALTRILEVEPFDAAHVVRTRIAT
jgi:hypothetical protein